LQSSLYLHCKGSKNDIEMPRITTTGFDGGMLEQNNNNASSGKLLNFYKTVAG
jgi:hypothetical protein